MRALNCDLDLLDHLAEVAAQAILPHFRCLATVENKAGEGYDPVTVADRAAEAAMREVLARERPHDAVWGEEFPPTAGTSGRTWILDPIDGTRGFMTGMPTWGVLVALADASGPVLGMMSQPFVGERFVAGAQGAFHRIGDGAATRLATRSCARLDEAVMAVTSPQNYPGAAQPRFRRLADACRLVRYGTDCYAFAMVAAGQVDLAVETGLKPYDIAPFVPMIEAAGGALTDWAGRPLGPTLPHRYNGEALAVGDRSLLEAAVATLAEGGSA